MSRENREQYQVVIQAKDMGGQMGGLSGTTTVNITLTDVNNNPPRFPQSKRVFSDIVWKVSQTHCEQLNVFAPSLCIQMNPQTLLQQNVTISLILKWRIHLQCRGCRFDPWVARQSRGGNGNPFQYSCLGNPIDKGAWWSTVHRMQRFRHVWAVNTASLQSDYDHFYHWVVNGDNKEMRFFLATLIILSYLLKSYKIFQPSFPNIYMII